MIAPAATSILLTAPYVSITSTLAMLLPLLALAALLCMRYPSSRHRTRHSTPTVRQVDIFLNRLMHKTWYEDMRFVTFRIDCFLFDFRPEGLEKQVQYEFFEYARTLDLANQQAIIKLYIWLLQHRIKFDLRFQWNKTLPARYNWQQRTKPAHLKNLIASVDQDELMAYDLSKDSNALHP